MSLGIHIKLQHHRFLRKHFVHKSSFCPKSDAVGKGPNRTTNMHQQVKFKHANDGVHCCLPPPSRAFHFKAIGGFPGISPCRQHSSSGRTRRGSVFPATAQSEWFKWLPPLFSTCPDPSVPNQVPPSLPPLIPAFLQKLK